MSSRQPPDVELAYTGDVHVRPGVKPISVWRDRSNVLDTGCVGGGVWSASPVFIRFLAAMTFDWQGVRVLELGAGGGTVGMALARLGANVTLSDTSAMLPVLAQNVQLNFNHQTSNSDSDGTAHCIEQLWGEPLKGGPYDVVVGSDIVYMEGTFKPLVSTMVEAASQGANVLMAYAPMRGEAPSFEGEEPSDVFMREAETFFDVETLEHGILPPPEDNTIAPFGHDCEISIYRFTLKPKSATP